MFLTTRNVVVLALLGSSVFAANPKYYLALKASKAGSVYPNNVTTIPNAISIIGFNFSATAPRDTVTGGATGRLTVNPVTLYKEMDVSSPLLMQVLTTHQVFQATITAVENGPDGHPATTFAWKLTNGALGTVSYQAGPTQLVEMITMFFQKMDIDATAGGGSTVSTSLDAQNPVV